MNRDGEAPIWLAVLIGTAVWIALILAVGWIWGKA